MAAPIAPSGFGSIDPAPSAKQGSIEDHRSVLLDAGLPLFTRFRSLFALRNTGGVDAVAALCEAFSDNSALLRHEVAYVLGQMQDSSAIACLSSVLSNLDEHVMVRHEAAEALGAIGNPSVRGLLQKHTKDHSVEVSESCLVALDLLDWLESDRLEYA